MTPPNLSLLLIMICFWCTMWLVHRFLIRPIGGVLEQRQGHIDQAAMKWQSTHQEYLSSTERLGVEMQNAAREAGRVRGEHRQRALDARQASLEAARTAADDRLGAALVALDNEATTARGELRVHADGLARQFATRLLGRKVAS
jgi:F0F1-type ATP synthase membrane subunit b/b'